MVNNLFTYATKELSQDAFICWLCSFAMDNSQGEDELKNCAKQLLADFLGIEKSNEVKLMEVQRQYKNIDVLLHVEYKSEKYAIIVEDKVYSSEHDNQLERYKKLLAKDFINEKIVCIYYKTGFQSNYEVVEAAGYRIFGREQILELLGQYIDKITNNIFLDYYSYWKNYDDIAKSYKRLPLVEWNEGSQVNCFYDALQNDISSREDCWAGYGWVNNRGGGFWGFWYGINDGQINYGKCSAVLYLQTEISWNYDTNVYDINICLKYERKDGEDEDLRKLKNNLMEIMLKHGFVSPNRTRFASVMTIGRYKTECSTSDELKIKIIESLDKGLIPLIVEARSL